MRSPRIRSLALLLLSLLVAVPARAGGDPSDGHSHGTEVGGAQSSVRPGVVTTSAMTARFEVVLKHVPVRGGEPYLGTLHLADFATNRPVSGAAIQVQALGVTGEPFAVRPTDEPGVYAVARPAGFPRDGRYDVTVSVQAGDVTDLVLLQGLFVGPVEAPVPAPTAEPSGGDSFPWVWALVVAVLGAGFAAFLLRSARQRRQASPPGATPTAPAPPARRTTPEPSLS